MKIFERKFILLLLLTITQTSFGQWLKVMDLDSSAVIEIRFDESTPKPTYGYALVGDYNTNTIVYRTTDGGFSWEQKVPKWKKQFLSLSIKNKDTAWAVGGYPIAGSILDGDSIKKTTDGGKTWFSLNLFDVFNGSYYNHSTDLFLVNGGGLSRKRYSSNDEGDTWSVIETQAYPGPAKTGIDFVDGMVGLSVAGDNVANAPFYSRTTDGGITWLPTSKKYEDSWQPLAIKDSNIFYVATVIGRNILRSDDGGASFDTTYNFPKIGISNTIVGDLCHLYVQSGVQGSPSNVDRRGVFESTDQGKSWHKVADLLGRSEFRFYFRNNILFVGDMQLGSDPPKPNSLWRYELPPNKPTMVGDDFTLSVPCGGAKDTSVMIAAVNHCDGEKVRLDTVYQTGSSAFTLPTFTTAKEIVTDTLHIHYQPQTPNPDTAYIHLRYYLKGNTFDTVMTVIGTGGGKREEITFHSSLSPVMAVANSPVELLLTPDKSISNKNLSEIAFTLTYNADVLDGITATTDISGATVALLPASKSGRYTIQPIIITGTNMSLAPAIAAARLKFQVMLSDSTSSPLRISDVKLNTFDPDYERCTLSATSDTSNFNLQFLCGDSTLVKFLRTNSLQLSIHPNPTTKDVAIEYNLPSSGEVSLELFDELGNTLTTKSITAKQGANHYDLQLLPEYQGTFYLRLQMWKDVVTGKFVKQ